jgi:hypothetical protein
MKSNKNILSFLLFAFVVIFAVILIQPIGKQEIINIARNRSCPVKLYLVNIEDLGNFETCISFSLSDFKKFSLEDKTEIVANFIIYAQLEGGRSELFWESITPYKNELIPSLENISDLELQQKYQASGTQINKYRWVVEHYKKVLTSLTQQPLQDLLK